MDLKVTTSVPYAGSTGFAGSDPASYILSTDKLVVSTTTPDHTHERRQLGKLPFQKKMEVSDMKIGNGQVG